MAASPAAPRSRHAAALSSDTPPSAAPQAFAIGAAAYVAKMTAGVILLSIFETSIAKMRVFRVPEFLGASLMLGFLGVLLLFVSRGL